LWTVRSLIPSLTPIVPFVEALRDQLEHLTLARREITLATHPPLAWGFRLGMRGSILNRAASMLCVGVRWTCMN
jgi:hypothetical protein